MVYHDITLCSDGSLYCHVCGKELVPGKIGECGGFSAAKNVIAERQHTHGDYSVTSSVAQALKYNMHNVPNWPELSEDKKESLEMIATKLARILCGDSEHEDAWKDISGYAELIRKTLTTKEGETTNG